MNLKLLVLALFLFLKIHLFSQGAPACPSITPIATPPSFCQGNCTNLTATVVSNNQTTGYSVGAIPYAPYAYTGGTGVSVGTDDVWSPVINLGFTFCYFGNAYTQAVIGSNGQLTFKLANASTTDNYVISAALPSTTDMPGNTICAAYRDIDPSLGGNVNYYTTGTAPCRALVIYWKNIPLFDQFLYCTSNNNSFFQLVLYENTNYIDVYIQNSESCPAWNGGFGIVGIQNNAATVAVCPPGRNFPSAWTANNEAWRFTPTGAPSYTVTWTGPSGVVGTGLGPVNVCPVTNTTYTATMNITDCNGTITSYSNTVGVTVTPGPTITVNSPTYCAGGSAVLTASGGTTYSWTPSGGLSSSVGASVTANPTVSTTYTVTGTTAGCSGTATSTVTVNPTPTVTVNSPTICKGSSTTLTASGATTYSWSPGTGLSSTSGTSVTANPTVTTTYTVVGTTGTCTSSATSIVTVNPTPTVTVNSPTICIGNSATLTASGATTYSWTPGTGLSSTSGTSVTANPTVTTTYTIVGTTGTCTSSITSTVTVNPSPTVTVNSATICPGATATLTASGANTYTWSPATGLSSTTGASVTSSPTVTTTYTITATSVAGCTTTATSTVTVGGAITPTVNSPTICSGSSTTLTASGGTTYTWSPGTGLSSTSGSTVTANPTVTTTYTITAASGACTGTVTSVVTVNPLPTVTVNSPTICVGNSATLTANGATTYNWSPGTGLSSTSGTSVTANPTVTTTYTIVGTTGTCTSSITSTVTVNPSPTVTVNSATICPGATATLTASGANTYTWSPATGLSSTTGASVTASPTVTTTYTITATSVAGCTTTATSTVTVGGAITPTVNSPTICSGSSTTLTASGGTTYTWSPGTGLSSTSGSTVTANPTVTTTYTITAASGACTGTVTSVVTVNPLPTVTVNSPTICVGNSATLTANGATTYSWSPGTGLSSTTGASVTANPTVTTTYTITGTTGTCTSTATSIVTVNPLPTVTVNSGVICNGSSVTLNAAGASTYSWSPGTGLSATTGASVNASPATSTQYTITGTDINGCANTATTSVNVVTNPTVTVTSATICAGSTGTLTANGAVTYAWSPGTGLSSTTASVVTANPGSTMVYTITGTAGTCTAVATTTVTVNPLPVVGVNSATICVGQQTATLTANGASTYSWNPGTGLSSTSGSSVTANPTSTTNYTITGTDINGCINTATTSVTVNPLPTITVNSATICPTFSATLNAGGANTYTWSTGANGNSITDAPASTTSYTVAGTDVNGCISANTATITVNATLLVSASNNSALCAGATLNLNASTGVSWSWTGPGAYVSTSQNPVILSATSAMSGTYSVTATDANGCQGTAVTTVTVNPVPVITIGSNSPVCVNQNLNITSSGGPGYAWSGPNSFSSTAQNPTINGVSSAAAGTYSLVVTDANSCVSSATISVVVNPLPVVVATGATVCIGSPINLTATGGTNYSWGGPLNYNSSQQNPNIPNATVNMSGSYVVTVTDINGCVNANVAQVTVNPALTIVATNNGPICQNATLNLFASSGVSWTWGGPGGFGSFSQNPIIPNAQVTVSGIYTVTGTDANGCTGTDTTNVLVNPLPNVTVNSDTICATQQTAILIATGAATYSWSPATGLSSTNGTPVTASPLVSITYIVTGTDQNGCINFANASVTVNQLPNVSASSGVICLNDSTQLTAGGASTYTWSPTNGLNISVGNPVNASPASTTSYTVTGTDNNGCFSSAVSLVTVNPLPTVSVNSASICPGKTTLLNASGASTYIWTPSTGLNSNAGSLVTAGPNSTTTYSVIGTDANGCRDTATSVVTVTSLPPMSVIPPSTSGCVPVCVNLSNTTTITGTYNWSLGDGSNSTTVATQHCYTVAGTFYAILALTDSNGCVNKDTAIITVYPVPTADFSFDPQPTTILDPQINFLDLSHGANITQWNWTFGDAYFNSSIVQNPSFSYQDAGSFIVQLIVTSDYGCKDSSVRTVVIGEDFMIYVPNAFTPNFDGSNDTFFAKGEGVKDFRLYIFDRWGNQVFFSNDIHIGWDGRFQAKGTDIVEQDVYVWKIELKTFKGEPKTLKGIVSLLK